MSVWTVVMIAAVIYFVVLPSLKDRVVPVKKLIITPAIFMYLFYQAVNENFIANDWVIAMGIFTGVTIGILLRSNTVVKADKNRMLIFLPGNYLSLVTFSLMFAVHFAIGYLHAVNPGFLTHASVGEEGLLFLLACASTMNVGANGVLYWKYLNCQSGELVFGG